MHVDPPPRQRSSQWDWKASQEAEQWARGLGTVPPDDTFHLRRGAGREALRWFLTETKISFSWKTQFTKNLAGTKWRKMLCSWKVPRTRCSPHAAKFHHTNASPSLGDVFKTVGFLTVDPRGLPSPFLVPECLWCWHLGKVLADIKVIFSLFSSINPITLYFFLLFFQVQYASIPSQYGKLS